MEDNLKKFKGKIMYHIFVDSFYRGGEPLKPYRNRTIHNSILEDPIIGPDSHGIWCNDYYGGDIKGIIKKLPYIKSLGVSILYLSPIVESQSNHGYDASDFEVIDHYKGSELDLKNLCDKAHEMGMSVILDGVFNHTGNDSKYFNEYGNYPGVGAFQSKESPWYEIYRKIYGSDGKLNFDYWFGFKNMPQCDGLNPKWINYITGVNGVIDKWFSLGIDGLRLDVADELLDSFIYDIRKACRRNKDEFIIIGEVWKNAMRQNRNYVSPDHMDTVMNYLQSDAMLRYFKYSDTYKFGYVLDDIAREYPDRAKKTLMNFASTHDTSRGISILGNYEAFSPNNEYAWDLNKGLDLSYIKNFRLSKVAYERAKELLKLYNFTLCFMPGIFSIFYGDEVGVQGLGNILNRKAYPWGREDLELLGHYREIGRIRAKESFLEDASTPKVLELNNNMFMFERESSDGKILTAVNRTDDELQFRFPDEYAHSNKVYTLRKSRKGALDRHGGIAIKID